MDPSTATIVAALIGAIASVTVALITTRTSKDGSQAPVHTQSTNDSSKNESASNGEPLRQTTFAGSYNANLAPTSRSNSMGVTRIAGNIFLFVIYLTTGFVAFISALKVNEWLKWKA
jgi:hypothetical protein